MVRTRTASFPGNSAMQLDRLAAITTNQPLAALGLEKNRSPVEIR
jgi:hypothetical protein